MSLSSSILQSIIAINSQQIDLHNISYQSYRDILKDFRQCGKSDDEAYLRYTKSAEKELRKLHLLERNQRELLDELTFAYQHEDFVRLTEAHDAEEGCYA